MLANNPDLTFADYFPTVIQVVPQPDRHVIVYFNDGRIVDYQLDSALLEKGVFRPLADPDVFADTCCVLNGTLAWDLSDKRDPSDCIDIDPCMLYDLPSANARWANE